MDYSLLQDIPTVRRDADHRYVAAPLVLLYVRSNGNLIPLAIQLKQHPAPDNPIWTPHDRTENWILAKLWVLNADFQYQLTISHVFRYLSIFSSKSNQFVTAKVLVGYQRISILRTSTQQLLQVPLFLLILVGAPSATALLQR